MATPSKVQQLPDAVRVELDRRLIGAAFGGYDALVAYLEGEGYEISRSAVGRYGKDLKDRLARLRDRALLAHAITENVTDGENKMSQASLVMVESQILDVLYFLDEAEEEPDTKTKLQLLNTAGRTLADLARAGVTLKRFVEEQRAKATSAAEAVEKIVKKGGLSDEAAADIRAKILGITS